MRIHYLKRKIRRAIKTVTPIAKYVKNWNRVWVCKRRQMDPILKFSNLHFRGIFLCLVMFLAPSVKNRITSSWTNVLVMKLSVNYMSFLKFRTWYQCFAFDCKLNTIIEVINRQHILHHDGNVHPYDSRFNVSSLCCGGSPLNSAKASGL